MKPYPKAYILLLVLFCMAAAVKAETFDRKFEYYNASDGLSDNSAQTLYCTPTGRLVITTMGQINFYDGQRFSFIDPTDENRYYLPSYTGYSHMYFDQYDHMWLKDTHSVTCVDMRTERFVDSVEEEFMKLGIAGKVRDMFVDRDGALWALTAKGLYNSVTKRYFSIEQEGLQDLEIYNDQYLLLFYDDSRMNVYERSTGALVYQSQPYTGSDVKRYNRTSLVYSDGNGMFYQLRNGESGGRNCSVMLKFDIGTWKWERLLDTPYWLTSFAVRDSLLYVASAQGFWTYNLETKATRHYDTIKLGEGSQLKTDMNAIVFDQQGGLWIGTQQRGLLYSRPFNSPFNVYQLSDPQVREWTAKLDPLERHYRFRDKSVNCVFKDSRGWTWVGTNNGLHHYRHPQDKLPHVTSRRDGLMNNVIHCITEDVMGNIWVGTSYGISCLIIDHGEIDFVNSYNLYDYLPEESFVNGRARCLPDSTIIMQQLDHMVAFRPTQMTTLKNDFKFQLLPRLIRLMVNGTDLRQGDELNGDVILEKAFEKTDHIHLNYEQNSATLTFSALNFFRPMQTCYRVRVKGLDDEWTVLTAANSKGLVDRRGMLHLPLVSLKPGTYRVEVQASMSPHNWDAPSAEWIVTVKEPWWRATALVVLFTALMVALLLLNLYYFLRNSRLRSERDKDERGLVTRLKSFAERCDKRSGDLIEPNPDEVCGLVTDPQAELSDEFIDAMIKLIPYVSAHKVSELSMRDLSQKAGIGLSQFYPLVLSNVYKSPRPLVCKVMLQEATTMLLTTSKSVGDIAEECGFITPNYFIASFYRAHRMTPDEYRRQHVGIGSRMAEKH